MRKMDVMLLAAGFGKRMLPLTLEMPKPAIPVLGRPIIVQTLAGFATVGVDRVVMNLHHLPEFLPHMLGEQSPGLPEICYSVERDILGTGGGIRKARPLFRNDGPLVVTNGDFLSDISLEKVLKSHTESGMAATLVLAPPREGYSRVLRDTEGRVVSLAGSPQPPATTTVTEHLFTGFHILNLEALDRIPRDGASNIVTDVYRDLARLGRLGSYIHTGFWWEFGDPSLYWEGSMRLLDAFARSGQRVTDHDPVQEVEGAWVAVGAGARWASESTLRGRVSLGFASQVSRECYLEDVVVMPEAWIGPGAHLRNCVVAPGVEIPIGFHAQDALIVPPDSPYSASSANEILPIRRGRETE